jgi:type II restriction enzyme
MRFECDLSLAAGYKNQTQTARVLSENWFGENGYCLSCVSDSLSATPANTKASDFICPNCSERYELKTFLSEPRRRLVDGAYSALMSRIQSGSVPTLMLMEHSETWRITALTAIHHLFLTPEVVEKRKPLSPSARRAGWIGCNIRLDLIGTDAKIPLIRSGVSADRQFIREQFQKFEGLRNVPVGLRGWTTLTLKTVRDLKSTEFSLKEVYEHESDFIARYPNNRNVRAKIRQQLQVLRDLGLLDFKGDGSYRLLI